MTNEHSSDSDADEKQIPVPHVFAGQRVARMAWSIASTHATGAQVAAKNNAQASRSHGYETWRTARYLPWAPS